MERENHELDSHRTVAQKHTVYHIAKRTEKYLKIQQNIQNFCINTSHCEIVVDRSNNMKAAVRMRECLLVPDDLTVSNTGTTWFVVNFKSEYTVSTLIYMIENHELDSLRTHGILSQNQTLLYQIWKYKRHTRLLYQYQPLRDCGSLIEHNMNAEVRYCTCERVCLCVVGPWVILKVSNMIHGVRRDPSKGILPRK